jgi:ABC-2 type transport system ATP-binding protein
MSGDPPPDRSVIHASEVTKLFGPEAGLRDLDLDVEPGSILGMIGPSGAGKTTAVRLLTGLLAPDGGTLTVLGRNPTRFPIEVRQRIGYLPQENALYPTLSIRENVSFAAAMHGLAGRARRRRVRAVLEIADLTDVAHRRVADASGGMKRRAGLAAALVHEPDLVFLDEPTAGIDPILRHSLWTEFEQLRRAGTTVVVTTQYVGEAVMCDELVLLSEGAVAARGTPEQLQREAHGGEIVDVRFDRSVGRHDVERIGERIAAVSFRGTGLDEVEFVVADAATATAEIHRAADAVQLTIVEIERRYPDMDDAFVRIVGRRRQRSSVGT